ncbi:S-adenosylmethionine:tRNA ribosyltransferase-isomerase [Bacillus pakistanensis]|uniref:S-adenosylmethionine:tRNA ribosyltransferase-isomerase n=1 Tax=Rossellomorea pakistanensis TaxID=992288 RepID=A0ABS2NBB7_9BACI|nr:S-adenosylmethionine:tRNA ribosyltransferase-isomerase [Bacillus pakistanensis]MBM7585153.1 S-adenosylmethionine:tRNA ribosyltransferase-isomerase [Bacillus pakistanensis]
MSAFVHSFQIPDELNAKKPKEILGKNREDVRLMVLNTDNGGSIHTHFNNITDFFEEGDLLVFNNSRTIPAVLDAKRRNQTLELRLSRKTTESCWEGILLGGLYQIGDELTFDQGLSGRIIGVGSEPPLVKIEFSLKGSELLDHIYRIGQPIRYEYIDSPWPLESYQTAYASVPGSVEMPSAGRAFSWGIMNKLKEKGVQLSFLSLHAGLSYYGNDQWPTPTEHPEEYIIPTETAELINQTKRKKKRIIAVGTTVVRALETVGRENPIMISKKGITNLYIDQSFSLKIVDGLLTGFHEPEASHLALLSAFVKKDKLLNAYREAIELGYYWHEFGDMNLIIRGN